MSDDPGVDEQKVIGDQPATPKTKSEKEQAKAAEDFSQVEDNGQPSMKSQSALAVSRLLRRPGV